MKTSEERPIRKLIESYKDGAITFDELKDKLAVYPYKPIPYSPPDSIEGWEAREAYIDEHIDDDLSGTWDEVTGARTGGRLTKDEFMAIHAAVVKHAKSER